MKKKSTIRGAAKRTSVPKTVEDYLARVPEPARSTLMKVRAAILSAAPPDATEAISYGIPTVKYKGSLLAFAAFSNHCSLFPMSYAVIKSLHNELRNFEVAKGTIRFPLDKPMSAALLRKFVKARIAEKERKQAR